MCVIIWYRTTHYLLRECVQWYFFQLYMFLFVRFQPCTVNPICLHSWHLDFHCRCCSISFVVSILFPQTQTRYACVTPMVAVFVGFSWISLVAASTVFTFFCQSNICLDVISTSYQLWATALVTCNDLSGLPNTFVFCCVNSFVYFLASF